MAAKRDLEPRQYQLEALQWALRQQQAVCCLPTGTGKTLLGLLWVKHLIGEGTVKRALVLEPTRLLVNQTATYYDAYGGLECPAVDGRQPPEVRRQLWASNVVVATPHTAHNDIKWLAGDCKFEAVVIDECHHTLGQHPFAQLMNELSFAYKLGISATVPQRLESDIVHQIGVIRRWSWEHEEIRQHMPRWIGELYEADLAPEELAVLESIRGLPAGGRLAGLLERYLTRDGSAALLETTRKGTRLSQRLHSLLEPHLDRCGNQLHKMDALKEVLDSHDFAKAIVFTDRKVVARAIVESFPDLTPALLQGGHDRSTQTGALKAAASPQCKLVVATSAGEEGIDLPSADLVVSWGSVASEIRFVQRQGRIMRKTGPDHLKFAVFIVTPETADYDSFVKGLERAQASNHIDVEQTFGWDSSVLWPKTTWWSLTSAMHERPQSLASMESVLGVRAEKVDSLLQGALARGRLFYFYDVQSIATEFVKERIRQAFIPWDSAEFGAEIHRERAIEYLKDGTDEQLEYLRRKLRKFSTSLLLGDKRFRLYALSTDAPQLREACPEQFATSGEAMIVQEPFAGNLHWLWRRLPPSITPQNADAVADALDLIDQSLRQSRNMKGSRRQGPSGFSILKGKAEKLRFFYVPASGDVLTLLAANGMRLFELADRIGEAADTADLVQGLSPWL